MWLRTLLLIALLVAPAAAQVKGDKKFSKVPSQWRARLVDRLNLYFEYERTQQYDKLYNLVSDASLAAPDEKMGREVFIKENQETDKQGIRFVALKIKVVSISFDKYRSNDTRQVYFILLDIKSRYAGRIGEEQRMVEAHLERGDWYFRVRHIEVLSVLRRMPDGCVQRPHLLLKAHQ